MPEHKQWSNIPRHWQERLKPFARQMRKEPTEAEALLWQRLRRGQVRGAKFRRQHPIGPFIVDFFCVASQLAIELDGGVHEEPDALEYDAVRAESLRLSGVRLLRFTNGDVIPRPEWVLERIEKALIEPR